MNRINIDGTAVPKLPLADDMTEERHRNWHDFCGRVHIGHVVLCVVNSKQVYKISDEKDFSQAKNEFGKAKYYSVPEKELP